MFLRASGCTNESKQNSHFWGRGNSATRYDPENCDGVCGGCHMRHEGTKQGLYRELKIAARRARYVGRSNAGLEYLSSAQSNTRLHCFSRRGNLTPDMRDANPISSWAGPISGSADTDSAGSGHHTFGNVRTVF